MSTIDTAYTLPQASALPGYAPAADIRHEPWGFWGSLGWGLFAMATGFFAVIIFSGIWMLTHGVRMPDFESPTFSEQSGVLLLTAPIFALAIAVKLRKFSLRDYFALNGFTRRDLVLGVACLIALIVTFEAISWLFSIDAGTKHVEDTYRAAKAAGILPLLWLSVVVVAPVTEELFFRGFLHRGWAPSWIGVSGTIVLTAGLWAVLHQQYTVFGILLIFVMGLILGWLRQRSQSTWLPMALHALNNLIATVSVAIQIEWLS